MAQFFFRFGFALVLVYASYNPSGYSLYHWAKETVFGDAFAITPPFAMSAIVLMIGWTIYIRATLRSLGAFGLSLAFAFFAIIIWWLVDIGLLGIDSVSIFTYIVLFLLAAILATGMSWSHIRRRMSGQSDVDDLED
ncbi:MAG: hypothetical protein HRT93_04405 [Piscirickettsiaceae bacterium]|nr:hypothetical protein [Piscirickettsiaceae bacterium]